jgi:SAM-dependent methyltransferase
MGTGTAPQVTTDFRSLDFDRLWTGRENTTTVERTILAQLLEGVDTGRVLEIGTGSGRLTPVLRQRAEEYVALDLHPEFLTRIPWGPGPTRSVRVAADAHHPPFVGGAFTAIVVVRVYNFLPDPPAFLRKIYRLLAPGGHLVIGYQPHPSLATLVDDCRLSLQGRRPRGTPTMTFSRAPQVPSGPGPFPAWLPTRRFVRSSLERSGFVVDRALSSGIEDYSIGRRLPPRVFIRLAQLGDRTGILPTQFVLAHKPSGGSPERLPPWTEILACPQCGEPFGSVDLEIPRRLRCPVCKVEMNIGREWIDARGAVAPAGLTLPPSE